MIIWSMPSSTESHNYEGRDHGSCIERTVSKTDPVGDHKKFFFFDKAWPVGTAVAWAKVSDHTSRSIRILDSRIEDLTRTLNPQTGPFSQTTSNAGATDVNSNWRETSLFHQQMVSNYKGLPSGYHHIEFIDTPTLTIFSALSHPFQQFKRQFSQRRYWNWKHRRQFIVSQP